MFYDVYIWLLPTSEAAEIFQQVQAESAALALQVVMAGCALSFADFAWVVPQNERLDCESFVDVGGTE